MVHQTYSNPGMSGNIQTFCMIIFVFFTCFIVFMIISPVCAADPDPLSWTQVVGQTPFADRGGAGMAVYAGKMWIIGGGHDSGMLNDVWYSSDGVKWEQATAHAPFSPRSQLGVTVFDNKLWVIGGYGPGAIPVNDVWYSEDGSTWTEATDHASFLPRYNPAITVFNGKMWVIGGGTKSYPGQMYWDLSNDVWYSSDGATWTEATPHAAFPPRTDHATVSFDGKMWVINGWNGNQVLGDIWYSSDGATWQPVQGSQKFPARDAFQAVIFDGKIWVMGGQYYSQALNDVWFSSDGLTWTNAQGSNLIAPRVSFNAVLFKDRIWVSAGSNGSQYQNDVWATRAQSETESGNDNLYGESGQGPNSSISVSKIVVPQVIKKGTDAQFTITLTNSGLTPIHDIEILDVPLTEFPVTSGQSQYTIPLMMPNDTRILRYTVSATKPGKFTFNSTSVMYGGDDGNYHLIRSNEPTVIVLEPLIPTQPPDQSFDIGRSISDFFRKIFS